MKLGTNICSRRLIWDISARASIARWWRWPLPRRRCVSTASRIYISKAWVSGSPSLPASGRSRSSGGSAVPTFGIRTDGFKKASIGEQGRGDSAETGEGLGEGRAVMDGNKGGLVGPPCSRNAHDEAVVVRDRKSVV